MPRKLETCGKCKKKIQKKLIHLQCTSPTCSSKFYHIKCCKFRSLKQFERCNKSLGGWTCNSCVNILFPFSTLDDASLSEVLSIEHKNKSKRQPPPPIEPCYKCNKIFKINNVRAKCTNCHNKFHLKCIDLKNRQHYEKIDKSTKGWMCETCKFSAFPFMIIDDDDLINQMNMSKFSDLIDLRDTPQFSKIIGDCPSEQFTNWLTNFDSKYYEVDELHDFMKAQTDNLSMIHFNTVNLTKKLDDLENLISQIDNKFQVIAVSETKLQDQSEFNVSLPGFQEMIKENTKTSYGGVGLYLSEGLSPTPRDDLHLTVNACENVWIELPDKEVGKKTIIGVVYRHPGNDIKVFQQELDKTLQKINKEKKLFYILGDFNIDLKHCQDHENTKSYVDMLFSNLCCPVISKPTRVTSSSQTIIDHIYTNAIDRNFNSGILIDNLSDHFPIFVSTCTKITKTEIQRKYVRDYTKFNETAYNDAIRNLKITESGNPSEYHKEFMGKLNKITDEHAPLIKQSKRQAKLSLKPWITPAILKSIKRKQKMYVTHFLNGSNIQKQNFKNYNTTLNRVKEESKRNYLKQKFKDFEGNMKKTWKLINDTVKRKSKKNHSKSHVSKICYKGREFTSAKDISDKFNEYFQDVGPSLASKISPSKKNYKDYLKDRVESKFFLRPTTFHEVSELIEELDSHKALGLGDIPIKLIKSAKAHISEHLTKIFNLSFETGEFPMDMKYSKIIPLHKGGSTSELSNYRPISLTPIFSKILEKIMYKRIIRHLIDNDVLFPYQFGFRKSYSTNLALAEITQNIFENLINKRTTCGVFLDLKKAFDTIDHDILLGKLEHYGIRDIPLTWFKSYLKNRFQRVFVNDELSDIKQAICGVPQGSILGPLLFLIYINDLANSSDLLIFRLFADDTNIFMSDTKISRLQTNMNTELKKVNEWLKCNFLSLNVSKTKFLIFHYNNNPPERFFININGKKIEKCSEVKYLGVYIDDKLTFKFHTDYLCTKISKSIGIIAKLRHYADLTVLKQVYYGVIYPHLLYGIMIWGNGHQPNLNRLRNFQNKIINLMHFSPAGNKCEPLLYKRSSIIKLKDMCMLQASLFVFDFKNGNLPKIFDNFLKPKLRDGNMATRGNEANYYLEFNMTKFAKLCFKTNIVKAWEQVPLALKTITKKHLFKKRFKKFILLSYAEILD